MALKIRSRSFPSGMSLSSQMLVKFFSSWYSVLHELTYVEGLEILWDLYDRNVQVKKLLVCKVGLPHCIKHREERRVPHVKDSTLHCHNEAVAPQCLAESNKSQGSLRIFKKTHSKRQNS